MADSWNLRPAERQTGGRALPGRSHPGQGRASGVSLVAQAPTDAYFAQSLQAWEQGRFVRRQRTDLVQCRLAGEDGQGKRHARQIPARL